MEPGHVLGIWICGCSLFYRRELWASKSAGFNSTKSLKICGCKRWCPKDLWVCAVMCTRYTCANTFPDKSNLCHASHSFYLLKCMFLFNSYWHCAWFISWTLVIRHSKNLLTYCIAYILSSYPCLCTDSVNLKILWNFFWDMYDRIIYINAEITWNFLS